MSSLLQRIEERWLSCTACDLRQMRQSVVFGAGSPKASIVFFGDIPNHEEDATGAACQGRSGQRLKQTLMLLGIPPEACYFSTLVCCRPVEGRVPMPYEVEKCRSHVDQILGALQPKAVVLLGGIVMSALGGKRGKIRSNRGKWTEVEWSWRGEKQKTKAVMTYHPFFLLHEAPGSKVMTDFERDIRSAAVLAGVLAGPVDAPNDANEEEEEDESAEE